MGSVDTHDAAGNIVRGFEKLDAKTHLRNKSVTKTKTAGASLP